MNEIYGAPQPLNGGELVTIWQTQSGLLAKCTMPLSQFLQFIFSSLPTTKPTTAGLPWNNSGVVSIS